jgi:hypothetical protein
MRSWRARLTLLDVKRCDPKGWIARPPHQRPALRHAIGLRDSKASLSAERHQQERDSLSRHPRCVRRQAQRALCTVVRSGSVATGAAAIRSSQHRGNLRRMVMRRDPKRMQQHRCNSDDADPCTGSSQLHDGVLTPTPRLIQGAARKASTSQGASEEGRRSAAPPVVALGLQFFAVHGLAARFLHEQHADDEGADGHNYRVPEAGVDVARRRHDGEGGDREEAAEPAVADVIGQ